MGQSPAPSQRPSAPCLRTRKSKTDPSFQGVHQLLWDGGRNAHIPLARTFHPPNAAQSLEEVVCQAVVGLGHWQAGVRPQRPALPREVATGARPGFSSDPAASRVSQPHRAPFPASHLCPRRGTSRELALGVVQPTLPLLLLGYQSHSFWLQAHRG